jgi:hypothetical protein
VSIYQAGEQLYDHFDKVCIIAEGKMAYFGPARAARQYFIDMGYEPHNRQTTADFLVGGAFYCRALFHISFASLIINHQSPTQLAVRFGQGSKAQCLERPRSWPLISRRLSLAISIVRQLTIIGHFMLASPTAKLHIG